MYVDRRLSSEHLIDIPHSSRAAVQHHPPASHRPVTRGALAYVVFHVVSQAYSERNTLIPDSDMHYCWSYLTPAEILCASAAIHHPAAITLLKTAPELRQHHSLGSRTNSVVKRLQRVTLSRRHRRKVSEIADTPLVGVRRACRSSNS